MNAINRLLSGRPPVQLRPGTLVAFSDLVADGEALESLRSPPISLTKETHKRGD